MIIGSEKCELIAPSPNSSRSKKFHDCSLQEKDTAKISNSGMAIGKYRRQEGHRGRDPEGDQAAMEAPKDMT
ncbi:hypothetical protein ACFVTJ_18940 [Agrobacterium sp. NPDC058088]|uniref:hypothetical protein n=1 Tax=Agrobacterium sp. NPDC058088 TaxID=3346335 RepID=UPI0036D77CC2